MPVLSGVPSARLSITLDSSRPCEGGQALELLFNVDKETPNKLRWVASPPHQDFKIYVPKWRVPEPWPRRVTVSIDAVDIRRGTPLSKRDSRQQPSLRWHPVQVVMVIDEYHERSIRYAQEGDEDSWEVSHTYIPYALTEGQSEKIVLTVSWRMTAGIRPTNSPR
jgi:hypothetical protein